MSILSLSCSPKREEGIEVIAVVDLNQNLSFFDMTGEQVSQSQGYLMQRLKRLGSAREGQATGL